MIVKNNYNECLTNLACSIRKYFELDYKHNTLSYVDEILEKVKPKNIITILCDGMGSNIMERILDSNSFLVKNKIKNITTVFPATTVAATTSMMTGMNPVETGMLGWDMYFKDIDKIITTYLNSEKGDSNYKSLEEAIEFKEKHMKTKSIIDEINEKTNYKGYVLFPFGDNSYKDLDELFDIIESKCNEDGKKYIYAYYTEPDSTMHELGTNCVEAKNIIIGINNRIEKLSHKLNDTIIFVVADHGHKNVININLNDYPDLVECLVRNTSLEPRAVNFFIKEEKKETFKNLFKKYFNEDFDLYDKNDIIDSKLFGDGEENEIFRGSLGDYLAIAKTDKTILYIGSDSLKSQHAGYTDDEIFVPLILINTNKYTNKY
ncbi:MAG TPA: alkaline phosphatase family protein [bacterium]|nr:alkaline phosphatase family protein [bacterium]